MIDSKIQNSLAGLLVRLSSAIVFVSISGCAIEKARSSFKVDSGYASTSIHMEVPTNKITFDVHGTSKFVYLSDTYTLTIPRAKDDVAGDEINLFLKTYPIDTKLTISTNSKVHIVGKVACVIEITVFNLESDPYPINGTYKVDSCQR